MKILFSIPKIVNEFITEQKFVWNKLFSFDDTEVSCFDIFSQNKATTKIENPQLHWD